MRDLRWGQVVTIATNTTADARDWLHRMSRTLQENPEPVSDAAAPAGGDSDHRPSGERPRRV